MVIIEELTPKGETREVRRIIETDLRSEVFKNITRTADGGIKFEKTDWDEFDNGFKVIITLDREDVEEIKSMIDKGLL